MDENLCQHLDRGDEMKLKQSATDPCIFYKQRKGKVVLVLLLYVDDTLFAGEKKEGGRR